MNIQLGVVKVKSIGSWLYDTLKLAVTWFSYQLTTLWFNVYRASIIVLSMRNQLIIPPSVKGLWYSLVRLPTYIQSLLFAYFIFFILHQQQRANFMKLLICRYDSNHMYLILDYQDESKREPARSSKVKLLYLIRYFFIMIDYIMLFVR